VSLPSTDFKFLDAVNQTPRLQRVGWFSLLKHTSHTFHKLFKLNENSAGMLLMHYQSDLKASELYADFVPSRPFRLIHVNVQIRTQNFFRKKTTSRLLHVDRYTFEKSLKYHRNCY
jgi:hypothetical protein